MKKIWLILAGTAVLSAGETRTWTQGTATDFSKGTIKNLTIRSDGRLSVAPKTTEVFDSSTAYLWALARDSKGTLYTAGGPGAKLFRIPANGKGEKFAEFDALEIHAIAIDSKDRVYAATAPDGKIYRVGQDGKSEEFFSPARKYVWAMVCDAADNLYVATGDQGEIFRVTPEGKSAVFFKSDETHIRSLAFDRTGNLIAGTDPGGLVIRVSPKGEGFVMYQMAKREVTALAVGAANEVYAAAVGSKTAQPSIPPLPTPARPGVPVTPTAPPGASGTVMPSPAVPSAAAGVSIPGGSDVYRISAQGSPEKIWSRPEDVVYSLALDAQGHLLIGSGNKGNIYRVETRSLYSTLVTFPVAQVTALVTASDGSIYASTGNVGKVLKVGPGREAEGSVESDVLDAGGFSLWGRLSGEGDLHRGSVQFSARTGNLDRPQENWSGWSQPIAKLEGGRIAAPAARFLQWRAVLSGDATLDSVDAAYLPQNAAPVIDRIEFTPPNYKFPDAVAPLTLSSPLTLTLPAIGSVTPPVRLNVGNGITPTMQFAKGAIGVRWSASDENGDALIFRVEIRGEAEKEWKLLRDKVRERYLSFDSQTLPDGDYRLRLTASDSPSNPPADALSTVEESDPFTIDNAPPRITKLAFAAGNITWHAADALSNIRLAEYSLDGSEWAVVEPGTKLSDSKELDYTLKPENLPTGEHTVAVRVTDEFDNVGVEKIVIRR